MDGPICVIRLLFRGLQLRPIIDEVHKRLGLHRRPRHVFQSMRPKLYSPLGNPARRFPVLDDITQALLKSGTLPSAMADGKGMVGRWQRAFGFAISWQMAKPLNGVRPV